MREPCSSARGPAYSPAVTSTERNAWLAAAIPYVTVPLGMHVLHSAWAALGLYHAGMIAVLIATRDARAVRSLFRGFRPAQAMLWIVLGLLFGALVYFLWPIVRPQGLEVRPLLASLGLEGFAWWAFAFYFGLFHPGLEEAFWRGHIAPRVGKPWITDVLFGGYHATTMIAFQPPLGVALSALGLMILASVWRRIARANGGLAIPWIAHGVADSAFGAVIEALARV